MSETMQSTADELSDTQDDELIGMLYQLLATVETCHRLIRQATERGDRALIELLTDVRAMQEIQVNVVRSVLTERAR